MALSGATKDRLKAALGRKFAADEVDAAASTLTSQRLRSALYEDALATIAPPSPIVAPSGRGWLLTRQVFASPVVPWTLAGILGGILFGIFLSRKG